MSRGRNSTNTNEHERTLERDGGDIERLEEGEGQREQFAAVSPVNRFVVVEDALDR